MTNAIVNNRLIFIMYVLIFSGAKINKPLSNEKYKADLIQLKKWKLDFKNRNSQTEAWLYLKII